MILDLFKKKAMLENARSVQSIPLRRSKDIINAANTSLFCRHELKYRISETKARAITQYIQSYISPDRYAKKCNNYEYPISSLYLDSDQLHLCRETIDGRVNRFKLRIRGYNDLPESKCFFEIKRRINNVIFKSRAGVFRPQIKEILRGGYIPESLYKNDREKIKQFQFYTKTLNARPVVLVRYLRQAFENNSSNRIRITFDRQLSFKTTHRPVVTVNGPGWRNVSMDFVVLEIKFTSKYPLWLSDMVKIFDLKQTAMSKYVSSIKQSCALGFSAPTWDAGRTVG
ncbi:MAG: VTC domain-containing protein [Planctomycetota bacterium]|jgi:SPX domain protein involved in polyphosphate accumulation